MINFTVTLFCSVSSLLAGIMIVSIAFVGTADVISYRVLDGGIPGAVEISSNGVAAAFFLALPKAQLRFSHVFVDIVYDLFRPRTKIVVKYLSLLITILIFGLMGYVSIDLISKSFNFSESAQGLIPFSIWPLKMTVFIGCVGSALVALYQLFGADLE